MSLYAHQVAAVEFLAKRGFTGAIFADMGTGKTLMALEAFRLIKVANPMVKMVVCAPLSLLEAAWGQDIAKFTDFTYYNAHDRPVPKEIKEDILLINYDAVITRRAALLPSLVRGNLLVADESSRMKNNQAKTTKIMLALGKAAKFRIVMSGTPAPNSPMEYWGQIEFIRPRLLHASGSFYAFRNSYFHLQRGAQIMQGKLVTRMALMDAFQHGFKYEITPANMKKLMGKISAVAYRIKKEDCLDLPEQVDEVRFVYLGSKAMKHYKEIKHDLITEIKHEMITAEMALTKIMKLREITAGFIMDAHGQAIGISREKITELLEIIDELGEQQVIVWCQFRWEMREIERELVKIGTCVVLNSETEDRDRDIKDFKEGRARFAICHPASVAHGITWVGCSVQVFFSLDYSLERYLQARARIHRIGQVNKCTYIHLLAKDTIDEDIYAVLKKKGKMVSVMEGMMKERG
jgi:SNF2 family DNA or RNA helicase